MEATGCREGDVMALAPSLLGHSCKMQNCVYGLQGGAGVCWKAGSPEALQ